MSDLVNNNSELRESILKWSKDNKVFLFTEPVLQSLEALIQKAEIKARIGMVEYYDQASNNKDVDWKGLFKDNLIQLKYELAQLNPQEEREEK